jgi:hypothetical protein
MKDIQKVTTELFEAAWFFNENCEASKLDLQIGSCNTFDDETDPPEFLITYEGKTYKVSVEEAE